MDAAPIALIAFSYLFGNPKKVSANTAAAALGVSSVTLVTYLALLPKIPIATGTLVTIATAGFLGGITGVFFMHRIKPLYVRYTMVAILSLAFVEITEKIVTAKVPGTLHILSIGTVILGLFAFLYGTGKKFKEGKALPAP